MSVEASKARRGVARLGLDGVYVLVGHSELRSMPTLDIAKAALDGGACALQLRDKISERTELELLAEQFRRICSDTSALFIVNDDPWLARRSDADGVHVGQSDASVSRCRTILKPRQIVGRSNATVHEARDSMSKSADYVAVGTVFPTSTKGDTRHAGIATLADIVRMSTVPVVAIGGINAANVCVPAVAGADAVCVASAVTDSADPMRATWELRRNFEAALPHRRV